MLQELITFPGAKSATGLFHWSRWDNVTHVERVMGREVRLGLCEESPLIHTHTHTHTHTNTFIITCIVK